MIEPVLQGFIRSALVSVDLLHMAAFLEKYESISYIQHPRTK
jgi:hypothetical protein